MKATLVAGIALHLLGDVDDGAADPALAQRGGGEEKDDRLLPEDVREVLVVHRDRWDPGVDLGDVGDLAGGRRRDARGVVADGGRSNSPTRLGVGNRLAG